MQLDQITFTRFIAALTVVFFHYGNQAFPLNVPLLENVLKAGPIAVNYFYLLSGFIMAIAYYRPDNKDSFSTTSYWVARFARIYPVYLVAMLLIAATKIKEPDFLTALALNTSLLQAWIPDYALSLNSPGWSLSVEAFFYLCFPALLIFIYKSGIKSVAILGIILWLLTQVIHTLLLNSANYQAHNSLHNFIYYNPLMHVNAFILGFIVGILFKQHHQSMNVLERYSLHGIIISSVILILVIAFQDRIPDVLGFDIALTNGQLAPLFLAVIVFLALNTGKLSQLLSHQWLVLLGEASFSLYILQRPVHSLYEKLVQHRIALPEAVHFYIYLILLIIISIASFRLFESPARHFIRSLKK